MIKIQATLPNYEGYSEPEIVNINEVLDLAIYKLIEGNDKPIIALVRKDEFDITDPFLLKQDTFWKIANELEIRGIV